MSENQDIHRYVMGDRRSAGDTFKSQWRLDLERGRAEEEAAEKAWEEVYGDKR